MTLAGGICGALFDRERSGRGHLVSTSLLRAGIYIAGWDLGVLMRFGKLESTRHREAVPRRRSSTATPPPTAPAFWLLGLEADRHWPGLAAALERDDLRADERFAGARARLANTPKLIAELDVAFAARPMAEWIERFDVHDVWWAPINTARSVARGPPGRRRPARSST